MAIVRCVEHIPEGKDGGYVISIEPVGYPETAAVCGRKECNNPGLVWLKRDEPARVYRWSTNIRYAYTDNLCEGEIA